MTQSTGQKASPYTDYIPDQHTDQGLYTHTVIMEDPENPGWQFFLCEAEDGDHAEEQAIDAWPECVVLWVNRGLNFTQEDQNDGLW